MNLYLLSDYSAVDAVIGEVVKWIPMSSQRFSSIEVYDDGTTDLNFTRVTNQVMPSIVYILNGKLWSRDCLLDPSDAKPACRIWEPSLANKSMGLKSMGS